LRTDTPDITTNALQKYNFSLTQLNYITNLGEHSYMFHPT